MYLPGKALTFTLGFTVVACLRSKAQNGHEFTMQNLNLGRTTMRV
jgi:uncharacterized protein (DUF885 family)